MTLRRKESLAAIRRRIAYYRKQGYDGSVAHILAVEPKWVGDEFRAVKRLYTKKLRSKKKGKAYAVRFIKAKFGSRHKPKRRSR